MDTAALESLALSLLDAAATAGAESAEAFVRFNDSTRVEVEGGRLEGVRRNRETAGALRVLLGGRMGFSSATGLSEEMLPEMASFAVSAARLLPPGDLLLFPPAGKTFVPGLADQEGLAVPFENKKEMAFTLESAARAASPKVKKVHKPSFSERRRVTVVCSGDGHPVAEEDTLFSLSIEAVAEERGEAQAAWDYAAARHLSVLNPALLGRGAGKLAAALLGGKSPATCSCAALFPPRVAVDLLGALLPSFSAEEAQKGRSRLAGREGEALFSPRLSIRDDGALPGGAGSASFDDEGVPPVPRLLVDKGVFTGWLHSLQTAARAGSAPTGNGFRGAASSFPLPGPANLFIEPGPRPLDPFAPGYRAVRVEELMGVHTVNPVTGDFSLGAAGFLLRDRGEPIPFRNAAVSGNLMDFFRSLAGVGDDLVFYGGLGSPSLHVNNIIVTGT